MTTSRSYKGRIDINSECVMYRDPRTTKQNYIIRILMDDGRYKLRTTKTDIFTKALARAQTIFDDVKLRERQKLPFTDYTLNDCLAYWLKHDGSFLTPRRAYSVERFFNVVVVAFVRDVCNSSLGLELKVKNLSHSHLIAFVRWRAEYFQPHRKGKKRALIAPSTLELQIANFNVVMRSVHRAGKVDKLCLIPSLTQVKYSPKTEPVRLSKNTFTPEQVKALSQYLKTQLLKPSSKWNREMVALEQDGVTARRREDGATRSVAGKYISRVNLYVSFFLMLNTGLRSSECLAIRWKDIERHIIDTDAQGRQREIFLLRINELKSMRRKITKTRIVVAPIWLEPLFNRLRVENPEYCGPDDYIINYKGRKRTGFQSLFVQVQRNGPKQWGGKPIDCLHHEDGTILTMGHLRSFYATKMLVEQGIRPHVLINQTGHSLETLIRFYLDGRPQRKAQLALGGWEIDTAMVDNSFMSKQQDVL